LEASKTRDLHYEWLIFGLVATYRRRGMVGFCQKNEHQGAWRTCQGGVADARNPVTEAVSDIEAGATIRYLKDTDTSYSKHTVYRHDHELISRRFC